MPCVFKVLGQNRHLLREFTASYGSREFSKVALNEQKRGIPGQRNDASHSCPMMKSSQSTNRRPHKDSTQPLSQPHSPASDPLQNLQLKETQHGKLANSLSCQVGKALEAWMGFSMYKIKAGIWSLWSFPGHVQTLGEIPSSAFICVWCYVCRWHNLGL